MTCSETAKRVGEGERRLEKEQKEREGEEKEKKREMGKEPTLGVTGRESREKKGEIINNY